MVALFFIYFLPKHVYFESFFENSQVKTSAFPTYAGVDQLEMFIIFFFFIFLVSMGGVALLVPEFNILVRSFPKNTPVF